MTKLFREKIFEDFAAVNHASFVQKFCLQIVLLQYEGTWSITTDPCDIIKSGSWLRVYQRSFCLGSFSSWSSLGTKPYVYSYTTSINGT